METILDLLCPDDTLLLIIIIPSNTSQCMTFPFLVLMHLSVIISTCNSHAKGFINLLN